MNVSLVQMSVMKMPSVLIQRVALSVPANLDSQEMEESVQVYVCRVSYLAGKGPPLPDI